MKQLNGEELEEDGFHSFKKLDKPEKSYIIA